MIDAIRAALQTVPEPCGLLMRDPVDICEMGLVDSVACDDGDVRIELVLTDPSCVHFGGLQRYIADAVGAVPGVVTVTVTASRTQLWTPDRRESVPSHERHRRPTGLDDRAVRAATGEEATP